MYGIEVVKPPERTLYRYEGNYWVKILSTNSKYNIQKEKLPKDKQETARILFQRVRYMIDRIYELEPVYIWDVSIPSCGKGRIKG